MRDIAGLLTIAFSQAYELSESVMKLDFGSRKNLSDQLADAAVSALAHVAAATASHHGDYLARIAAASSVSGGRGSLSELDRLLNLAHTRGVLSAAERDQLVSRCSDLLALLMAVAVEMSVGDRGRRAV